MKILQSFRDTIGRLAVGNDIEKLRPHPGAQKMCILNALPWSRAAFDAQIAERRHFVLGLLSSEDTGGSNGLSANSAAADAAWARVEEEIVRHAEKVRILAKTLEVPVREASVEEIGPALAQFDVIVLLAHSTGTAITARAITTDDPSELRAAIESASLDPELRQELMASDKFGKESVATLLDRHLKAVAKAATTSSHTSQREMVDLRHLGWLTPAKYKDGDLPVLATECFAYGLMREALGVSAAQFLEPGNAVDLRSGLVSYEELAETFPSDWEGDLDLQICESAYIANRMRQLIGGGRIFADKHPVSPVRALHIVLALLLAVRAHCEQFLLVRPNIDSYIR